MRATIKYIDGDIERYIEIPYSYFEKRYVETFGLLPEALVAATLYDQHGPVDIEDIPRFSGELIQKKVYEWITEYLSKETQECQCYDE